MGTSETPRRRRRSAARLFSPDGDFVEPLAPELGDRCLVGRIAESCGIAAGLFIAALHQMGLATLTHTPSPMGFLAEILERPPGEAAYILFPVGYPADEATVPELRRKGLDEVAVWRE